jgi:hypothetical protein
LSGQFINPAAIDWMQKESDLFTLLLMTLQGRNAGITVKCLLSDMFGTMHL